MFSLFGQNKQSKFQNFLHALQVPTDETKNFLGFDVAIIEKTVENKTKKFVYMFIELKLHIYDIEEGKWIQGIKQGGDFPENYLLFDTFVAYKDKIFKYGGIGDEFWMNNFFILDTSM